MPERKWQLPEAKNRLSQLVDHARHEGPQTITLCGKPTAVVISVEDFEKLTRPYFSAVFKRTFAGAAVIE
ncbi:MAG: type II toxin-antitoxin system Phd/YefM family antitoxin [Thermodesulfobacteriota bacterium]|nr:type II toxin-antitoxin system Phd/YefM family antitoxin [Thermodesulfobacteriota bacterium]